MTFITMPQSRSTGEGDVPDTSAVAPFAATPDSAWLPSTRYTDQPMNIGTRLFGIAGVSMIALLILSGAFFTWRIYTAPPASATLSVFDVAPPAAPPESASEVPPGSDQVEKEKPLPKPDVPKIEPSEIQLRSDRPVTLPVPKPAPDPGPPVKKTTAPESKPSPPAPQIRTGKPTWEGLVLGALNTEKRYPRIAQSRRQQGVPWIRFVIDREGNVLSVRLERSSGVRSLDDEAVKLPERAEPFPKPPKEVQGETIELVVPVEFFMR